MPDITPSLPYINAVGIVGDYGNSYNFLGVSGKRIVSHYSALQGDVGFGADLLSIKVFYQYWRSFSRSSALDWYVGAGPGIIFGDVDPILAIGPIAVLDVLLFRSPVRLFADWRPQLVNKVAPVTMIVVRFHLNGDSRTLFQMLVNEKYSRYTLHYCRYKNIE